MVGQQATNEFGTNSFAILMKSIYDKSTWIEI